ncbi:MAG: CPBP family intramembrane metalloprotease [Pseudobutyrivibrio sp.]|uniref:CPBP family intramembrane glutamic endopeptidase n=1 Tax=Pseudobutyrivibrio sp. TaxID=2014367 RepID=UPI0025E43B8B|nr:CPBP family intramembrane glutamic endopeptidase [Pseudobutyrivibrio sp.]MBQ6463630.1 CPBP family intramembrane metalloprotease [Pseudobutyrivibrio sp.]
MNQNKDNRGKYIFWIFIPCILALVIQYIASIVVLEGSVAYVLGTFKGATWDELMDSVLKLMLSDTVNGIIFVLYSAVGMCIFISCYHKMFMENKTYSLKGISKNIPVTIAGLLMFCIGMQYVSVFLMNALGTAFPAWMEEYEMILENAGLDDEISVLMGIYAVILGPIVEEFIFRGITFSAAKKVMPYYLAIIVQAILFGAFHMNAIQGCYAFVLGLGLGYIMHLYDNIWVTIMVHILYNLVGTFFSELLPFSGDTLISFFFSVLLALMVTYGGLLLLKRSAASVKEEDNYSDI